MGKFRKRPVVIEAFRIFIDETPAWFQRAMDAQKIWHTSLPEELMNIKTLEGVMQARRGDWIIQGVEGEIYPCKDSIFQATYEAVE